MTENKLRLIYDHKLVVQVITGLKSDELSTEEHIMILNELGEMIDKKRHILNDLKAFC